MLKKLSFFVTLTTLLASLVFAQDFYQSGTVPAGANSGAALDTSKKRAVKILSDNEIRELGFEVAENELLVANIFHSGKFYFAKLPIDQVEKTYFLIEPFALIMSHSMLRFQFKKGAQVELLAEVPESSDIQIKRLERSKFINDFLVSTEVAFTNPDEAFNPLVGLKKHYVVVTRVTSLTGRGITAYLKKKSKVFQLPLNFTPEESSAALKASLEISDSVNYTQMYHTLTNNCNVFSFSFLKNGRPFLTSDQSFCSKSKGLLRSLSEKIFPVARWYPPLAAFILKWRGYRDLNSFAVSLLNDDPEFLRMAGELQKERTALDCGELLLTEDMIVR